MLEPGVHGVAVRDLIMRKHNGTLKLQGHNLIYNEAGVFYCFRQIGEELSHLRGVLEVELIVVEGKTQIAWTIFIIISELLCAWGALLLTGVDAKENVVGVVILYINVVRIVAGYDGYVVLTGKLHQYLVRLDLLRYLVALQLYVVIISEEVQPPFEYTLALFFTLLKNRLWHFGTEAAGSCNQAFVVLQQYLFVNAGILAI